MIDRSEIVSALNAAVASCQRLELPPDPDFPGVRRPITNLQPDDGARLIAVLKGQADLAMFDERQQTFGHMASLVRLDQLAVWLVDRAFSVGAQEATEDLARYVETRKFLVVEVVALAGIVPEHRVDLGDGLALVPISELPACPQKEMLSGRRRIGLGGPDPSGSAALLYETEFPVLHSDSTSYESLRETIWRERERKQAEMDDARLVLSVVGPCAPATLISWQVIPPGVPLSDRAVSWAMPLPDGGHVPVEPLYSRDLERARDLVTLFKRLSRKDGDHLRIALHRLNLSLRRVRPVDRAIDLGICLDALFLSDMGSGSGELKFRMRLRAARYLGRDASEREQIFDFVGELYDIRSEAVHAGRLKDGRNSTIVEVLKKGAELAPSAAERMIREGIPDWPKLIHA